ncbi:GNAT family N-acetyltransferase [Streptomyces sp. A5-4]|uniref:GNAT family N-acetyltransferase n=1 Tax=Streptomyces sp. A5-4 TaxID=3384771 RepID=UPI003DA9EA4F
MMIRNATPADLDAITTLHAAARATYYRGHIPEDDFDGPIEHARVRGGWTRALARGGGVLCAEAADGTLAGVAAFREVDGALTLTQLHVAPEDWSRGIGTALHTACVASWQRSGVRAARLEVYEHNLRAQGFYARHGWRPDREAVRSGTHLVLWLDVRSAGEWAGHHTR